MKCWVIIAASGIGQRMKNDIPKQYLPLANASVIEYAIRPFLENPYIEKVVVVIAANDMYWQKLPLAQHPKIITATGSKERYQTVLNGLTALQTYAADDDWVLVHDAARPLITSDEIEKLMQQVSNHAVGGSLGTPIFSTVKRIAAEQEVVSTVPRQDLWQAATPQMFRYGLLSQALATILPDQAPSDCSQAIECLGYHPLMIECSTRNFKVTCPADLELAENILSAKKMFRIGQGYDLHRLTAGQALVLGGIRIECSSQIIAHSDGDVVLHAVCDALLGAIAAGDIGQHFADTDAKNAKRDSRDFLRHCYQLVQTAGYQLGNLDITIIAQVPKIAPYVVDMRTAIANELATDIINVSVKATTNEGVDAIGKKEAIAVQAVVLLEKSE